ncbi:MAG TPA: hypothetical protein VGJ45_25255 [Pseudonocardiaceae bacterium]|jgi:hypothetical protein
MSGNGFTAGSLPSRTVLSNGLTPATVIRTTASPLAGFGSGTVTRLSTS